MIRDLYFYVLKKKADVETGRRVLFLQQQQQQAQTPLQAQAQAAALPSAGNCQTFLFYVISLLIVSCL